MTEPTPKVPTPEEIYEDAYKAISLTADPEFIFHSVKVDDENTTHQEFDGSANFLKHVSHELSKGSGTPTRLFFFLGVRIPFSTPQITVGLTAAGQRRPVPVYLARGRENPDGVVPDGVPDGA